MKKSPSTRTGTCVFIVTFLFLQLLNVWNAESSGAPASPPFPQPSPETIRILPEIHAAHKRVSLFDLCDPATIPENWKTLMANIDIGESPAVGSQKTIQPDLLKEYLHRFLQSNGCNPAEVEISLPEHIFVKRQSLILQQEQIEAIYRDYILSNCPWDPKDLQISRIFSHQPPELPAGVMSYEVVAAPGERFLGNVSLTIHLYIDGEKERSMRVTGKVELYMNVAHARCPLKRDEVISGADVQFKKVNVGDDVDQFATDVKQLLGKQLLRDIGLNQPIALSDLTNPQVLKRGGIVVIVYEKPGLRLTAKGQARQDGCTGDTIRVTNVMTKRTVFCRVLNADTVQAIP